MSSSFHPNFTQTPNILFDEWMRLLTPAEFKVLMCISRKTYGWHRGSDQISLSQIELVTGLSRRGVCESIKALVSHGLIRKVSTTQGWNEANTYTINCIKPDSEESSTSALSSLGVGNSVHYPLEEGVGNSVHTQKKHIFKEKERKKDERAKRSPISASISPIEGIYLSEEQWHKLRERHGEPVALEMCRFLSEWKTDHESDAKKHGDYGRLNGWVCRALEEKRLADEALSLRAKENAQRAARIAKFDASAASVQTSSDLVAQNRESIGRLCIEFPDRVRGWGIKGRWYVNEELHKELDMGMEHSAFNAALFDSVVGS